MGFFQTYLLRHLHLEAKNSLATELLFGADPKADLYDRALWLARLLRWIKSDGAELQTTRLRYLFKLAENNPAKHAVVGATIRSIFRDCSALNLFLETGFAHDSGLWTELGQRLLSRLLPRLAENDLLEIITYSGWDETDAAWLMRLSPELLQPIKDLFIPGDEEIDPRIAVAQSAKEAIAYLASVLNHFGLSKEIRRRNTIQSVRESPFLQLQLLVLSWTKSTGPMSPERLREWEAAIGLCRQAIRTVHKDMEKYGVSVGLVYRLEVITASLQRIDDLLPIVEPAYDPNLTPQIIAGRLLRALVDRGGIRDHLRANLYLLSKKIAEHNGHLGGHYLANGRREFFWLFISGIGGGLIVVVMTAAKVLLHHVGLPPLPEAFMAWLIYSGGFLAMQFTGCTLATKLPSFLAAHLARKLASENLSSQREEIARDIRASFTSQFVALLGNVAGLVPMGIIVTQALASVDLHFFSAAQAIDAIHEVHPLFSLAIPLGALTGAELWLSSLAGGWFENWLVFQRVPDAIRFHPYLKKVFGEEKPAFFANLLEKHSSGFAANIALGFLFGFVPLLGIFLGVNTESRHVTIASTKTILGFASLQGTSVEASLIVWTILGLLCIGTMNFVVSFALALSVAVRASGVKRALISFFFNPFHGKS